MDQSKANTSSMTEAQILQAELWYDFTVSPGKGLGMFAARDIPKGTRILAEEPTLVLYIGCSEADINEGLQKLSQAEQIRFHRLNLPHQPESKIPATVRRYKSNCLIMRQNAGIFWDAAHVNHSCLPNAQHCWNTNLNRLTIHAIIDIEKGTEITRWYYHYALRLEDRSAWLFKYYGFRCDCAVCRPLTAFRRQSAIRRARIQEIEQELRTPESQTPLNMSLIQDSDTTDLPTELIDLLREEGLVSVELAEAYHYAAKSLADSEDIFWNMQARAYAKELAVYKNVVGEDSEHLLNTKRFVQEMQDHVKES